MQNDINNGHAAPNQQAITANQRLQKALVKREQYLARHPHLRAYQAEIDCILDKSGNVQGRLAVLGTLMQGKLLELQKELVRLNRILR